MTEHAETTDDFAEHLADPQNISEESETLARFEGSSEGMLDRQPDGDLENGQATVGDPDNELREGVIGTGDREDADLVDPSKLADTEEESINDQGELLPVLAQALVSGPDRSNLHDDVRTPQIVQEKRIQHFLRQNTVPRRSG